MYSKRPLDLVRIVNEEQAQAFLTTQSEILKKQIGEQKVLLALSGGVDSAVVAVWLSKIIKQNLICIHVNNGLLRQGESEGVVELFKDELKINLLSVDASQRFLKLLEGVSDPEEKRKIIGETFIKVFQEESSKLKNINFLAQGTIYPDILESANVKAHHNVGGLPEELGFQLIEPLKFLYKDEVRLLGKVLGLPDSLIHRQPFPGPGLAVRCLGEITPERLEIVRKSDAILREEIANYKIDTKIWQYFTVVPNFKSTGVVDGQRSYAYPVIIRAVNSVDAMSAEVYELPYELLHKLTERITKEVKNVNRVLYDLTPKPVGTIEWE
ncbi:glutamine-hydrolyzing GMP synthase [bacterium]|jgi:GMP synthase (glutamine-hydrolysing)|nr:glutamine-hydrolyzing GMP synthase [bacterium]